MAAARRAYSTAPIAITRAACPTCHGFGTLPLVTPGCFVCGATWTQEQYEAWQCGHERGGYTHIGRWQLPGWLARLTWRVSFILPGGRNRYRWEHLPCGHELAALTFSMPGCFTCRGRGTIAHLTLAHRTRSGASGGTQGNMARHREPRLCVLPKPHVSQVTRNPPVPPISSNTM